MMAAAMMRAVVTRAVEPARGSQPATAASILEVLDWAFRRECASLDFDAAVEIGVRSVGLEWVMMQRAVLGCQIDGGGRSDPHPDADVICAALATLPEAAGGRRMAAQIAELARAGLVPDAMVGVRPRYVPKDWHVNRHGKHPKTEVDHVVQVPGRGGRIVQVNVTFTPVRLVPDPRTVASARRGWLAWWGALLELRHCLSRPGALTSWRLTDEMPPLQPWAPQPIDGLPACGWRAG